MLRSSQNPLASPLATQPQGRLGQARVGRPGARASDGVVSPGGGGGAPEELVCLATMVFAGGRKRIVLRDASVRVAADRELGPGVEVIASAPPRRREFVPLRNVPVALLKNFMREGKATVCAGSVQLMLSRADPLALRGWLVGLHRLLTRTLGMGAKKSPTAVSAGSGKVKRRRPFSPIGRQQRTRVELRDDDGDGAQDSDDERIGGGDGGAAPRNRAAPVPQAPLCHEQQTSLRYVAAGRSILLTGSAGTGKTRTLNDIIASLPTSTTFVTATTGLAASHVGGMTVHAFAGVSAADGAGRAAFVAAASRPAAGARWRACSHLVVDEISMLSGEVFDALEAAARAARQNDAPFGGIQLVLSGDFYQLPPVEKRSAGAQGSSKRFAFEAASWKRCRLAPIELRKVHRQADVEFSGMLDRVREGRATPALLRDLKAKSGADLDSDDGIEPTVLMTHRADVDAINKRQLDELPAKAVHFEARDSGAFQGGSCPARRSLTLKVGAQVMLVRTLDARRGLVNGARGVVTRLGGATGLPTVRFACGAEEIVRRERWTVSAQGRTMGAREQLPLDLGWALSVHKSQGMTLDRVEMALSNCFECGQAYVALSRARSLAGLRVVGALPASAVKTHPRVVAFYATMRQQIVANSNVTSAA